VFATSNKVLIFPVK